MTSIKDALENVARSLSEAIIGDIRNYKRKRFIVVDMKCKNFELNYSSDKGRKFVR